VPSDEGERDPDFPDYRFTLANERTFLAWMRTSLALLAGGIALRQVVPSFEIRGLRTTLAVAAVVLSLVLAVASYVRWSQIERAMRRGEPLPHPLAVPVLATVIAAVAGMVAVVLLVRPPRTPAPPASRRNARSWPGSARPSPPAPWPRWPPA
jgi:putative membrane protein